MSFYIEIINIVEYNFKDMIYGKKGMYIDEFRNCWIT